VNVSAVHEGITGQCGGNRATEERPRAVPTMAWRRTGIAWRCRIKQIELETETKNELIIL
jgi:hypothetical protein